MIYYGYLEEKAYTYYFPCTVALSPLTPSLLYGFSLSPTAMPSVVLLFFFTHLPPVKHIYAFPSLFAACLSPI